MEMVPLTVTARSKEAAAKVLRKSGKVPCVLYGHNASGVTLQCNYNEIKRAYLKAGESTLVELDTGEKKKIPALFHALDVHPVTNRIIHADFYAVDMTKEITAHVPLQIVGEAPAVKELGGVIVIPHDHVTVECLPVALPHHIPVDISGLATFGATLTIGDLTLPTGVIVQEDKGTVVVLIQQPREEEAVTTASVEGAAAEGVASVEGAAAEGEGKDASAASADADKDKKDKGSKK
ncbi:MAG: 50S ribosomal protein L25 [Candidatus Peribacteraceae bacterium]|nr:50S ribosomal protein L25 [Candidatus Peribacteraceae bacterium]